MKPTAKASRQAKQEQANAKALNLKESLKLKLSPTKPFGENWTEPWSLLDDLEDTKVHKIQIRIIRAQTQFPFLSDSKIISQDSFKVVKLIEF